MDVRFISKKDRKQFFNDKRVEKIVDILSGEGSCFIKYINWNYLKLDDINKEFETLYSLYPNNQTLPKIHYSLLSIYKEKNIGKLGNLRGAIIERFVYNLIKTRYKNGQISFSCNVCINSWKSKETVDIGAWNNKTGECYECKLHKITISNISDREFCKKLENLCDIYNVSNKLIITGIASFASRKTIKNKILEVFGDIESVPIHIFGNENIFELRDYEYMT